MPTLPGPRYCHVGTQKRYDAEGRLITEAPRGPSFADHALKRYLAALERLASAP